MGLLDDLEPVVRITTCRVRTVMEELEKTDVQILQEALANEVKFSNYRLSVALNSRGVKLSEDAIRRHRLKRCSC